MLILYSTSSTYFTKTQISYTMIILVPILNCFANQRSGILAAWEERTCIIVGIKICSVKVKHMGANLGIQPWADWPPKVLNWWPTMSSCVGPWCLIRLLRWNFVGNLIMHHNHWFYEVEIPTLKIMLKWRSCKTHADTILHKVQTTFIKLRSLTP